MLIGDFEKRLLELVPAFAAEEWDRTGMLVGNPNDVLRDVAVALDPNDRSLEFAHACGANVLLTHHPLFLDPPAEVKPAGCTHSAPGAHIWKAVQYGISVISFHTALDANPCAAGAMGNLLRLHPNGELLEALSGHDGFGYGRICEGPERTVAAYAEACAQAFGRQPRTWGNHDLAVKRVCLWTGAAGDAPAKCLEASIDLLICGEVNYHRALDASEMGLNIIELGHDASEQVLCPILVELAQCVGVDAQRIHLLQLPDNWR